MNYVTEEQVNNITNLTRHYRQKQNHIQYNGTRYSKAMYNFPDVLFW